MNKAESSFTLEDLASIDERSSKISNDVGEIIICEEKIIKANKILPKKYTDEGEVITKTKPMAVEKSLRQMGISEKVRKNWQKIIQPKKTCLYQLLREMISANRNTNLQVRIGKALFHCHMMVLQCYSKFFVECEDILVIRLPEDKVSVRAFQMIYEWMLADYPLVQREGILELIVAAEFLKIDELYNQCWVCLDDLYHFNEDSAFILYLESRPLSIEGMMSLMLSRIGKFFMTLVASKEFVEFSLEEVCMLLVSSYISVNTEIEVFMSALRWLHYNWLERQAHIFQLMHCVRFIHMPVNYLVTLCSRQQLIPEIRNIIANEQTYQFICDSIAYCTTRMCYGDGDEEFRNFEKISQFKGIAPRRWIFDPECAYHHQNFACKEISKMTYTGFLQYLEHLQKHGRSKWHHLEFLSSATQITKPCCQKMINHFPNLIPSREEKHLVCDQSIQVESYGLLRGDSAPYLTSRSAQYSEPMLPEAETPAPLDVALPEIPNDDAYSLPPTTPSTQFSQREELKSIQIIKDLTSKCLMESSLDDETLSLVSLSHRTEKNVAQSESVKDVKPDATPQPKCCRISSKSLMTINIFRNLRTPKILIFGGIDPYCNRTAGPTGENTDAGPCLDHENFGDHVLFYESSLSAWTHLSYLPFGSRYHHAVVQCHGLIYLIGGTKTSYGCAKRAEFAKTIWAFNPATLNWSLECYLPELRRDFAAIAIENTVERCESPEANRPAYGFYVIGGEGINESILDTVWFYNIPHKQWTKKPSLSVGRYGFTATIVQNEIWIAGGIIEVDEGHTKCKECYGLSPGTACPLHEYCSNLLQQRRGSGDGLRPKTKAERKYIITDTVEYYSLKCAENRNTLFGDTVERRCGNCNGLGGAKWMKADQKLRIPRLFGRFCKLSKSDLFLIGGIGLDAHGQLSSIQSIDYFKFKEKEWCLCGRLDVARHGHDVVNIDGRMVIIGGVSTATDTALSNVEIFTLSISPKPLHIPDLPFPISGCALAVID